MWADFDIKPQALVGMATLTLQKSAFGSPRVISEIRAFAMSHLFSQLRLTESLLPATLRLSGKGWAKAQTPAYKKLHESY